VSTALTIRGQAADSAPTFASTSKNVSSRPRTAASVVQEVVNRSGWVSGNALALIVTGKGKRVAESYDGTRTGAPLLRVTYTVPTTNQPPTVNADSDRSVGLEQAVALAGDYRRRQPERHPQRSLEPSERPRHGDLYRPQFGPDHGKLLGSGKLRAAPDGQRRCPDLERRCCGDGAGRRGFGIGQVGANAVFALGDNQYEEGTPNQFMKSYDLSWGWYKAITYPVPGNHEYRVPGIADYYSYFGERAGEPAKGYYSFDLGDWHIVALNSNCADVGCEAGSEQEMWLRADLAAHPNTCTLAFWHHPLFSSGNHGNSPVVADLWRALSDARVDLLLVGHDHHYERFAPQTAESVVDYETGVRQFLVGTGGKNHYGLATAEPNSEVRNASTHGVLKLELYAGGYDWAFVPEAGATFTDAGSATCR
jgi:hypothetical protein